MIRTIGAALRQATHCLERGGIAEPRAAAEVLLADMLAISRPSLYLDTSHTLSASQSETYAARIRRRLQGKPVQYITGAQEFWSLTFTVNPHVLIPRPETELLVENGVRLMRQAGPGLASGYLLDVGAGSGNVAISLAHTLVPCHVWGIDISMSALRTARDNAQRLGVAGRVTWVQGDLTAPLRQAPRFALCASNLPYVTTAEWEDLPRDIKAYEPSLALCGGGDGLELIRRLIAAAPQVLAPGGALLLEVGWQQAAAVQSLLRQRRQFRDIGVYQDFAGIDRVVWARMW